MISNAATAHRNPKTRQFEIDPGGNLPPWPGSDSAEPATAAASSGQALGMRLLAAVNPQVPDLPGRWTKIEAAIRARASLFAEQNAAPVVRDPGSRRWLLLSSRLLAPYQELRPLAGELYFAITG